MHISMIAEFVGVNTHRDCRHAFGLFVLFECIIALMAFEDRVPISNLR